MFLVNIPFGSRNCWEIYHYINFILKVGMINFWKSAVLVRDSLTNSCKGCHEQNFLQICFSILDWISQNWIWDLTLWINRNKISFHPKEKKNYDNEELLTENDTLKKNASIFIIKFPNFFIMYIPSGQKNSRSDLGYLPKLKSCFI